MVHELELLKNQLNKSKNISLELLSGMKGDLKVRKKSVQLVQRTILILLVSENYRWKSHYEFMLDLIKYMNRESFIQETQFILNVNEKTAKYILVTTLKELITFNHKYDSKNKVS